MYSVEAAILWDLWSGLKVNKSVGRYIVLSVVDFTYGDEDYGGQVCLDSADVQGRNWQSNLDYLWTLFETLEVSWRTHAKHHGGPNAPIAAGWEIQFIGYI